MSRFIIVTKLYPAKCLVTKALQAFKDKSKTAAALYEKAAANADVLVLTTMQELHTWDKAIHAYQPINKEEKKIVKAMRSVVDYEMYR